MKRISFSHCLLATALCLAASVPMATSAESVHDSSAPSKLMLGDVAPDFSLVADSGQVVHLSDFRNKKRVIVYFFTNIKASDCADVCCAFRDCYKKYTEKDGEILAISPDAVAALKTFKAEHKLPFMLLSDPGNNVRNQWHVPVQMNGKSCKATYIIGKNGKVKNIITSEGTPAEYMKEIGSDWDSDWLLGY